MSGEINNREYRQQVIKELISELHNGKTVDEVKRRFAEAFDGVSGAEISAAEQALVSEGLPIEEVQRLCDVHAAVFKDALKRETSADPAQLPPGHPAHTLQAENRAIEQLIEAAVNPAIDECERGGAAGQRLAAALGQLKQINTHYQRKENLLFPYMEKHGITAPPKVMWGVDDEIRSLIKSAVQAAESGDGGAAEIARKAVHEIQEMIFKEENILIPMLFEHLTADEWRNIADESRELGYCLIEEPPVWRPLTGMHGEALGAAPLPPQGIVLPSGVLSIPELTHMLDALPVDITFVDKDDTVKYFSQGTERIFPRTNAVIGRKVVNCHPPASVHIVEGILDDFKAGRKTHEDFWINMAGKLIYIRYFAVRDESGDYLGTVELTQNIKPIQEITGEKRLVTGR